MTYIIAFCIFSHLSDIGIEYRIIADLLFPLQIQSSLIYAHIQVRRQLLNRNQYTVGGEYAVNGSTYRSGGSY